MTTSSCGICDGPCVCAELDAFLGETQSTTILRGVRMSEDMFEVGFGQSLQYGDHVLNLVVHKPGEFDPSDPKALMMSFGQDESRVLIGQLIATFRHLWSNDDEQG